MASQVMKGISKFRENFQLVNTNVLRWFPGHMGKGMKEMQKQLKNVDCIIEVHDARVPVSGRNPNFQHTLTGIKPHIFVLNKKDLTDARYKDEVKQKLLDEGISHVIYTNCKNQKCSGVKQIIPLASRMITASERYNRSERKEFLLMVIGVPNVGKSSLINVLRNVNLAKPKAARVGALAGITRSVQNKIKVCEDPLMYLLDTPGILTPSVKDVEAGLKLSLCASLQDHLVGEEVISDYLLFWLNKHQYFNYVEHAGLSEPSDDIREVLIKLALKLNKTKKIRGTDGSIVEKLDLQSAAQKFIRMFRDGTLGRIMLDIDRLPSSQC